MGGIMNENAQLAQSPTYNAARSRLRWGFGEAMPAFAFRYGEARPKVFLKVRIGHFRLSASRLSL